MTTKQQSKRTSLENLAGQLTTTAWDCCHKVSETQPDGSTTTWDYDDDGRMIASSRLIPLDMTNVTWLTTCYEYDDIGNRITSSDLGTNRVYTANNLNQYSQVSNLCASASLGTRFARLGRFPMGRAHPQGAVTREEFLPQFDDDGNQTLIKTATGIWQVQYNGENRPVQWTLLHSSTPDSSTPTLITMSYDRMGRRVTKNSQRFVYDGYLQIANFEPSATNSQLSTHNSQLFIWDPTEPVATRPLVWNFETSQHFNFSTSYYTHDGNKNVSEVAAVNCEGHAHYEYASFGAITVQCGSFASENFWRFSSEYAEDDTATVYYNYRHYEPVIGRWVRRDPILGQSENNVKNRSYRVEFNLDYCVCNNDLIANVDMLGRKKIDRYLLKKKRRFDKLCKKIESSNSQAQSFWEDFTNFVSSFLDQTPTDPRQDFIGEGLLRCWAKYQTGNCPACCVMVGAFMCDPEGVVPVVVQATVECGSCDKVAERGAILAKGQFLQGAPMNVSDCK